MPIVALLCMLCLCFMNAIGCIVAKNNIFCIDDRLQNHHHNQKQKQEQPQVKSANLGK